MKKSIIVSLLFVAQISFAQPVVKYRGAMSNMGAENFKGNILIDTLSKKNLFGIGPYGKMQGEITIVNGKPLIAQVQSDGNIQIKQSWQAEAPFFVYANVIDWQKYEVTVLINTLSDIQPVLENLAKEKGYPLSIPFPFRIESDIDEVTTHVVTPRSAEIIGYQAGKNQVEYTYQNTSGELIGFYSQQHQGVYTSKKTNIHIHYVSDDMTVMGHVDKILIAEKRVTIYLPSKSQSTGRIRIKTNDTDFSKGRLGHIQEITLDDVAKFHGHLCDGLVVGFLGLREALYKLYPDSIVDRTNTRIVSNPSPCTTDVGVYLTGGRYQFNTFFVDDKMKGMFAVARIDNNEAYQIKLKPGVKPTAIDSLGTLAAKDQLSACDLDGLKKLEDQFTTKLLSLDAKNIFEITPYRDFKWRPVLQKTFLKTDVLNKGKAICK
jgi:alpha-acetolactate decarboxylase/formylmethanofuran dehydrogenase subunit E